MSEVFGGYDLLELLGEGSVGEVHLAEHRDSGTRVALKRLSACHLGNAAMCGVFEWESTVARQLSHAHLLGALDAGEHIARPYFTMALVDGDTLETVRHRAVMPWPAIAEPLCQALQHMHEAGWVHADLSPANILVDKRGQIFLGDFSAACPVDQRQSQVRGTYAYMSPEQVQGHVLDARSDVFAAAIVLWELASGQRLFARSAPHLSLRAVVHDEPPQVIGMRPALEQTLRAALHKDPESRPDSIRALWAELARVL